MTAPECDIATLRALACECAAIDEDDDSLEGEVVEAEAPPPRRVLVACVSRIGGVVRDYRVVRS